MTPWLVFNSFPADNGLPNYHFVKLISHDSYIGFQFTLDTEKRKCFGTDETGVGLVGC